MMMRHLVMVVKVIFAVMMVVEGAQLEQVCQRREQEQKHLQEDLLGRAHAHDHWEEEHQLHLDEFDDQHRRHETGHQLLLEVLFYNTKCNVTTIIYKNNTEIIYKLITKIIIS